MHHIGLVVGRTGWEEHHTVLGELHNAGAVVAVVVHHIGLAVRHSLVVVVVGSHIDLEEVHHTVLEEVRRILDVVEVDSRMAD